MLVPLTISLLIQLCVQMPHTSITHFKKQASLCVRDCARFWGEIGRKKKQKQKNSHSSVRWLKTLTLVQHSLYIGCLQNIFRSVLS